MTNGSHPHPKATKKITKKKAAASKTVAKAWAEKAVRPKAAGRQASRTA